MGRHSLPLRAFEMHLAPLENLLQLSCISFPSLLRPTQFSLAKYNGLRRGHRDQGLCYGHLALMAIVH